MESFDFQTVSEEELVELNISREGVLDQLQNIVKENKEPIVNVVFNLEDIVKGMAEILSTDIGSKYEIGLVSYNSDNMEFQIKKK